MSTSRPWPSDPDPGGLRGGTARFHRLVRNTVISPRIVSKTGPGLISVIPSPGTWHYVQTEFGHNDHFGLVVGTSTDGPVPPKLAGLGPDFETYSTAVGTTLGQSDAFDSVKTKIQRSLGIDESHQLGQISSVLEQARACGPQYVNHEIVPNMPNLWYGTVAHTSRPRQPPGKNAPDGFSLIEDPPDIARRFCTERRRPGSTLQQGPAPWMSFGRGDWEFADLPCHMSTHPHESPEKWPMPISQAHGESFARKLNVRKLDTSTLGQKASIYTIHAAQGVELHVVEREITHMVKYQVSTGREASGRAVEDFCAVEVQELSERAPGAIRNLTGSCREEQQEAVNAYTSLSTLVATSLLTSLYVTLIMMFWPYQFSPSLVGKPGWIPRLSHPMGNIESVFHIDKFPMTVRTSPGDLFTSLRDPG